MGEAPVRRLESWGGLRVDAPERRGEDLERLTRGVALSRGLGRSYGDASLPPTGEAVASSLRADRILALDLEAGRVRAEAGCTVQTLNRVLWPRGWSLPVSPGTEAVTLGGLVAADVHGKNHHRAGTIGRHLRALRLRPPGGEPTEVTPASEPDLFWGTVGGMGLLAHVLEVELALERIPSPWLRVRSVRLGSLEEAAGALLEARAGWPFTAAWVDGLRADGRSVVLCGRWAAADEAPLEMPRPHRRLEVPCRLPLSPLSPPTVGLFNRAYWRRQPRRPREELSSPLPFFYPLDRLGHWSRLYGPRGMIQYQCVLPESGGIPLLRAFWDHLRRSGGRPLLAVLKDFGQQGQGLLSFPRAGFTLALDFPRGSATAQLVARLDELVADAGGRIYLAKDADTRPEHFARMEGERLERFLRAKRRWDPQTRLRSRLWQRLFEPDRPV